MVGNRPVDRGACFRGAVGGLTAALLGVAGVTATPAAAAESMTLQVATVFPEADFSSRILKHWMEGVTERTDGRIEFRTHWSGSLVGNKMLDGMRDGIVDVSLAITPYVSGDIIDLAVLDVPFSFPIERDAMLAFHREAQPIVDKIYQEHGSKVVAAPPAFLPDPVSCNDRFVDDAESWNGVMIRTAGRWQAETISRWGGSPVVLAMSDVYTGLDRGTVNCTLMVYNGVESLKLFEPAPYVTRIDHSVAFGTINVSNMTWDRLSEEDRQIMIEEGQEAMEFGADIFHDEYVRVVKELPEMGANLCVPSDEEFKRLVEVADSVIEDQIAGNTGPHGDALLEVVAKYRPQVIARPQVGEMKPCE